MDSGYYAAFSGLLARTQALDSAASNLSNANTTGFRAEREFFRGAIMGPHALESQLNETVNDFGVLGGNSLDLAQGPLSATGNPLDLGIEGAGFFAIQTSHGIRYTRDGAFQRARNGVLTTSSGEPVLSVAGKAITVPTGAVTIGSDGAVSVGGAILGQIGVFTFPPEVALSPEGVDRYLAPHEKASPSKTASLHQGSLEGSNQDVIQGSLQLILVQRQAEMMQKALTIFSNDFDKTASEDLPKVQ